MSGRLTIWIDGREALPVRAIPYVAGWDNLYHPESLARNLARKEAALFGKLTNLVAYHRPAGRPLKVMPHEWNAVVVQVKGFEAELRERRPDVDAENDHAGYAVWRKGAALKLPAGVFVWLDEFLGEREADRKRTPDDRPVILAPMLDADTRAAVLEGFDDCPRHGPDADQAMIDEYEQARIDELPADAGSKDDAVTVGAGATAPTDVGIKVNAVNLDGGAWPKDVWVREAWKVGTEWMLAEEIKRKERPGIVEVAKYVEGEFKRRDIRSKRLDDYLDWQTIKKEITGITERNKGDNFKSAMGNPQRKKHPPIVKRQ